VRPRERIKLHPGPIVLLTDFGLSEPYVGQMKGAVISRAPGIRIVDLCHNVAPYNIAQAGFFLATSRAYFPEGAVFAAVVDPGVGTGRRIVLLEARGQYFLAPDNGLLAPLLREGESARVWDVTPARASDASATFHGRDIFAPLAARLASGVLPEELGNEISLSGLVRLPSIEPVRTRGGVRAMALHVDRFGNCVLNLPCAAWAGPLLEGIRLRLISPVERRLVPVATYDDIEAGSVGILKGSQGHLELAVRRGSAAAELGIAPGDAVVIDF